MIDADARPEGPTLVARAAQLFERYQSGDRGSFDDLVEVLTPLLWQTVRSTGVDHGQAEDVVQTVWMALLRKSSSVRDPQTIVKWLLTSTRREAWRISKATRNERGRTGGTFGVDAEETLDLTVREDDGPEAMVFRDERQRRLWGHVEDLPARCRELLAVIAFADRPDYAAIASSLGMPVGSIGPTRGRCLAKLRDCLSRDPHWEGLR